MRRENYSNKANAANSDLNKFWNASSSIPQWTAFFVLFSPLIFSEGHLALKFKQSQ